ncbi:unnamed protein product [Trichobilharzia szidati]|nr:unnamed protein product [Trichobilharzia szidati]
MNNNIYKTADQSIINPCQTSTPITCDKSKGKRRGRRSTIPPEYREQTRRIKKQNLERRRRACISDKMNALHNLAMDLIGEDPTQHQKIEKTDILNICHNVFANVVAIVNEQPDIRERVNQLRNEFHDKLNSNQPNSSKDKDSSNINASNEKKNSTDLIPFTYPMDTRLHNQHYNDKQRSAMKSLNSNDINSPQLTSHQNIQHFSGKYHPTNSTPVASTDRSNKSVLLITPCSQSVDSGIEDIENTPVSISSSLQSIDCVIGIQQKKIPKYDYYYHSYSYSYDPDQSNVEVNEQVIDLSFKKQNQIMNTHQFQSTNTQNVWRPYLD